ncbi:MAG: hypothetical protein ABSC94_22195 [Polyangiaceae bacterium]|jgi:hypothetical protein
MGRLRIAPLALAAFALLGAWFVAVACSQPLDLPPELGNCDAQDDIKCTVPLVGSAGGHMPVGEGSSPIVDSAGLSGEAAACGNVAQAFGGANSACIACIEASCCLSFDACSTNNGGACLVIVECVQQSSCNGSQSCIQICESADPSGSTDYNDLAGCFEQNCNPACPSLSSSRE